MNRTSKFVLFLSLTLLIYGTCRSQELIRLKPSPPALLFTDKNGKITKEIQLATQRTDMAAISMRGSYALLDNSTYEGIATIILYNSQGSVAFHKQFLSTDQIDKKKVSDDGTVVVRIVEGAEAEYISLRVYNKQGNEILHYPTNKEYDASPNQEFEISSNGRYLAVSANINHQSDITMFFDLKKNTSWNSEKNYYMREMTDDGIAKVYLDDKAGEIDLKNKLRRD